MINFIAGFTSMIFADEPSIMILGLKLSASAIISVIPWVAGFLCVLNIILIFIYRQRNIGELVTYGAACVIELGIFVVALLLSTGTMTRNQIPVHLPPGLPFSLIEIGATLAIAIGLFPAAYWHRVNLSDLPERIAQDGKTMKGSKAGVSVRKAPGEWLN